MRRLRTLMAVAALRAAAAMPEFACVCMIMRTQLVETADRLSNTTATPLRLTPAPVAERPAEVAPAPVVNPRWQPTAAIVRPKTTALTMPSTKSPAGRSEERRVGEE